MFEMCGIAGKVNLQSERPVDGGLVELMKACAVHRGPDEHGSFMKPPIGFGFRRLAIIDLNSGQQPITNEDDTAVIVFNGEIYNFAELREQLIATGHVFKTKSDTETILHGYEQWGTDVVRHLRGMFAFAIYDFRNHALFMARDRLGKKPLYYTHLNVGSENECLLFASEMKSLLAEPTISRELDPVALSHYISLQYVPHPWSILKDVRKLAPAHWLLYRNGNVEIQRYWDLEYEPKLELNENEAMERVMAELDEAVRIRLVSEVPLGCFLSGGVDSSTIVAMMRRHISGPLRTFSIGFREQEFNELPYARQVAEKFETQHEELIVEPKAIECLRALSWYFDEPMADMSGVPTYYVSKITRQYVTVALNGDGGDESFGGYHRYRGFSRLEQLRGYPMAVRQVLRAGAGLVPGERGQWLRHVMNVATLDDAAVYAQSLLIYREYQKYQVLAPEMRQVLNEADAISEQLMIDAFNSPNARDISDKKMQTDIHTYLPGDLLVKADRMAMANSLEGRSPFLDTKLMELAARLPAKYKLRDGVGKYLLKKALMQYFPPEFLQRPKMGFGIPLATWLRTELREVTQDLLLGPQARQRGLFDHNYVELMWKQHLSETRDHHHRIWILMMFEMWCRTFIDRKEPLSGPLI